MSNKVQLKRTSVSGRAANTTTLPDPGSIAINMADGIVYSTNGTFVFEVGANVTNQNISANLTVRTIIANGSPGTAGQVITSNGTVSYWATPSGGGGGGSVSITEITVNVGSTPVQSYSGNVTVTGALTSQKVICSPSLTPGAGIDSDEFEIEPWIVAANVVATDTVRITIAADDFGFIHGNKKINLILG